MAKNVWVKIEKLVWHFSPKVPQCNFFIECRKLAPEQKVLKQLCGPERSRGSKSHLFPKNAFFGQKMTFFQKNHFIQNWSGMKTTLYAHAKKYFFLIKLWDCNFHQILPNYKVPLPCITKNAWLWHNIFNAYLPVVFAFVAVYVQALMCPCTSTTAGNYF